ncbi:MAG: helix-turn-helix transcriptional regulator [Saprospiraceae bacterium]|nr:helix-turn-helix transcriptional regulator [Saprospiraceae bacterium]
MQLYEHEMKFLIFFRFCFLLFLLKTVRKIFMPKYNRIKAVLADKDKTSKWLAEEVGRSKATVSRWCSNQVQPPLETLYQIADLLDVDVCELLVPNRKKEK